MPTSQISLAELFPEEFGEEHQPEPEPQLKPEPVKKESVDDKLPSKIYWQFALDVVNKWARYQATKKLYVNATHDETRHRVRAVVDDEKYYNGNVNRIQNRENELSYQLARLLAEFNNICEFYGVEPITREWLYDHLKEAKDYASYRGKIQRRLGNWSKYPAVSIKRL